MKKVLEKVLLSLAVLALLVIAIVALLISPVMVVKAAAEEFTITGYGPREFAVKGEIEQKAEKMIKGWGNRKPANIIVQGFADKIGKVAENDAYARDRAYEMKAFLETKTNAKIIARSLGDSENARKVVIRVEFVAALTPTPAPRFNWVVLLGVALVSFIFILPLLLMIREKRSRIRITAQPAPLKEIAAVGGYTIVIATVGGKWYSPFRNTDGSQIYASTKAELVSSVARCLKNQKFSEQLPDLLANGDLKKIL